MKKKMKKKRLYCFVLIKYLSIFGTGSLSLPSARRHLLFLQRIWLHHATFLSLALWPPWVFLQIVFDCSPLLYVPIHSAFFHFLLSFGHSSKTQFKLLSLKTYKIICFWSFFNVFYGIFDGWFHTLRKLSWN